VPLDQFRYPLRFNSPDFTPFPLDELAIQMRVSRGFLRLCVDAGCGTTNGKLSTASLLLWLFDHYEDVRAVAGLSPLVAVEDLPPAVTGRLRMANALLTLLEYTRTRATSWQHKRQLRLALEQVDRLTDRLS
jgi:hypothetical protein